MHLVRRRVVCQSRHLDLIPHVRQVIALLILVRITIKATIRALAAVAGTVEEVAVDSNRAAVEVGEGSVIY